MNKKIIFSSGGTGGHIFPAINTMKYFSKKGYNVILVTDVRGNDFLKDYPKFKPTLKQTINPGPAVAAIASISFMLMPLFLKA